uniref:Uncharacterized protein n=1 Tax=viral metagenome TaxID=1070528 RepID=A0A6C0KUF9_9ZZZZ
MSYLDEVARLIRHEYLKNEPRWISESTISSEDMAFLEKECKIDSEFDPLHTRQQLLSQFKKGHAPYEVKHCIYGQVIVIYENEEQKNDIPWGLWGRILRMYTAEGTSSSKPFKIYFLANTHLRIAPPLGKKIEPQHINGGYTYPCNHETIMIYRAEDATRVLLHELMHSSCMDHMEHGVDRVEAETEAWAELLYIGFLSQGNRVRFNHLHQLQSDWIQTQNQLVKKHVKRPMDFPARYTLEKEKIWQKWGIVLPYAHIVNAGRSLRLTVPPYPTLKKQWKVSSSSTIL